MRKCENCVHWTAPGPLSVDHRGDCRYPVPSFMSTFFEQAKRTLATDGVHCAVQELPGGEGMSRDITDECAVQDRFLLYDNQILGTLEPGYHLVKRSLWELLAPMVRVQDVHEGTLHFLRTREVLVVVRGEQG